ncbi:MAG: undecaprenyldiphospho-muramoylpentapeptide beta-N-acetylglucosaminyltransferase [bacterium]
MKSLTEHKYNFIFAGGGTGGHLYPLIAVAEQVKKNLPDSEILFVGTAHKIESKVVPALGYNFKSINISGFPRTINLESVKFIFKLLYSLFQSFFICIKFKPDVAIGSGAYVSGPIIWAAKLVGAKVVLLEQNSYPGVTNRILEKKADKIHISFGDSKKYFRNIEKLFLTGNPLRINVNLMPKEEAANLFGLSNGKKTIVVLGGSLGAKTINYSIEKNINEFKKLELQIIWQCGEKYYEDLKKYNDQAIKVVAFVENMGQLYSAADLVIARAGATTIAELAYLGVPTIFIPSPNVTDDHQYKNAKSIEDLGGAIVIKDNEAAEGLIDLVRSTIFDIDKLNLLKEKIKYFAKPDAAKIIGCDIIEMAKNRNRL